MTPTQELGLAAVLAGVIAAPLLGLVVLAWHDHRRHRTHHSRDTP